MASNSLTLSLRERKFIVAAGTTWTSSSNTNSLAYTFPVDIKGFKVLSYNIPNAWYPVNSRNNTIRFVESGVGTDKNATLTPGNYTVTQLLAEVKTQLEASNDSAITYTVTANANTEKVTITPSAGNLTLKFNENPLTNAADLLGFDYANTGAASTHTGTKPNKIVQGTESNILIAVGTSGNTVSSTGGGLYHSAGGSTYGIIAEIPVNATYGNYLNPVEGFNGEDFPVIASQGRGFLNANTTTFSLRYPIRTITPTGGAATSDSDLALVDLNQKPWMMTLAGTLGT